jgi:hypothetical protein
MGELSTSINDALLAVDLNTVELVTLQSRQKQTGRETQVVILNRLRKRIHEIAKKRDCSMNQLVNSALLVFYSKGGETKLKKSIKGRGSSVRSPNITELGTGTALRSLKRLGNTSAISTA